MFFCEIAVTPNFFLPLFVILYTIHRALCSALQNSLKYDPISWLIQIPLSHNLINMSYPPLGEIYFESWNYQFLLVVSFLITGIFSIFILVLYTLFNTRCSTFALAKKVKICSSSKNKNTTALKHTSRVSTLRWHIFIYTKMYTFIYCINHMFTVLLVFSVSCQKVSRHLSSNIL